VDGTSQPIELLVSVRRDGAKTLGAQLEDQLRRAIRDGALKPGARVPSTRDLARQLGVSRRIAVEAYSQLAAEGYLRTSPGAPTRVAPGFGADAPGAPTRVAAGDGSPATLVEAPGMRLELRVGFPDLGAFPRAAWLRALRRALASAPDRALVNGDPRGRPELRHALAGYLGRTRGVLADPERMVIVAGFTQGMALLCHALRASGAGAIAMEDPCLHHQRAIAAAAGLEVDDRGRIVTDESLRSVSHPNVYAIGDAAAIRQGYGVMHGTCQSGIPTALHAAASIVRELKGKQPKKFRFGYVHQPVSLGRNDAVIQFTHADDSPGRFYLAGAMAVAYKETVSSSPWTTYRLLKALPALGAATWRRGGRRTR
jgi:hypothetical protein